MIARSVQSFRGDESGAISPMYAVSILTLVAMAGIGFDYGRMVGMDTELQNAADQAALAAATQLDGGADSMDRAQKAARDAFATASSDFVNQTRFSTKDDDNDGNPRPITALTFKFYQGHKSDPDSLINEVPADGDQSLAKVVEVTVDAREVDYALTPLIGAISDLAIGRAAATMESATCNVPPLMFCAPLDGGVVDSNFPTSADIGKGLQLHMRANVDDAWAPGNFGFLDIPYDLKGNPNRTLGMLSDGLGCTGEEIKSQTGVRSPEAEALNTRLDMPGGPNCSKSGDFCPAQNVRKNYVRVETHKNSKTSVVDCDPSDKSTTWVEDTSGWHAGFSRDDCFADGDCPTAAVGDGDWSGDDYMAANHPGVGLTTASSNGSRYGVYEWELADPANRMTYRKVNSTAVVSDKSGTKWDVTNYCSYPVPINPPVIASATQKDRRVLTVAAVDCTGLNGHDYVKILRWVDLFLVEPADTGGPDKEFFTEIIGPAERPNGSSGFQYYGRKKAVLIR